MSFSTAIKSVQDIMRSALLQSEVKRDALLERWAAADREQIVLDGRVAEGGMVGERREKLGLAPEYADVGVLLKGMAPLQNQPVDQPETLAELVWLFSGKAGYERGVREFEVSFYSDAG